MPPLETNPAPHTVAVLLAGGVGSRVGGELPKQLIRVGGVPIMEHPLAVLNAHPDVDEIIIMMVPEYAEDVRHLVQNGGYTKVSAVLDGGSTRSATSMAAVAHLTGRYGDAEVNVLLHDAARPLLTPRIVTDCVAALQDAAAVDVAIGSADTIVEVTADDFVKAVPVRETLRRSQTPQCFKLEVLRRANDIASRDPDFAVTDDCTVVLRYLPDVPIRVVPGDERNLKVTGPHDIAIVEALLRMDT